MYVLYANGPRCTGYFLNGLDEPSLDGFPIRYNVHNPYWRSSVGYCNLEKNSNLSRTISSLLSKTVNNLFYDTVDNIVHLIICYVKAKSVN